MLRLSFQDEDCFIYVLYCAFIVGNSEGISLGYQLASNWVLVTYIKEDVIAALFLLYSSNENFSMIFCEVHQEFGQFDFGHLSVIN